MAFKEKNKVEEPIVETIEEETIETPIEREVENTKNTKTEMVVNVECLNVRKSADGEIIGRVIRNQIVTVDSVKGDWAKISKPVKGYCMVQYLK